jgi:hypothetical protein
LKRFQLQEGDAQNAEWRTAILSGGNSMDPSSDFTKSSFFTREQILWLMNFLGSKSLLGVNGKDSPVPADPEAVPRQLEEKGILARADKEHHVLNPDIRPVLEALFFPDQAMIISRDRPAIGGQIFYFLRKGPVLLMHCFPREGEHILLRISKPIAIVQILIDWLPLGCLPSSSLDCLMAPEAFNRVMQLAGRGENKEALEALRTIPGEENGKAELVNAIQRRKISGTIGLLAFQSNIVVEAACTNVLTDGVTAWTITQEDSSASREPPLRVRRTGADFTMTVRGLVERFAGEKLPRQQIDASARVTRFILTMDEIAVALASINCPELSLHMAAAASRGSNAGTYSERMQAAEQTLLDHGLCEKSAGGIPDLKPDLARAVFAIAQSDCMIDLKACKNDVSANSCIHIVHGRFFTAYYNYGTAMQLLEFGSYKDLPAYLEFLFPDFGIEKGIQKKSFPVSYTALEEIVGKSADRQAAAKALALNGVADSNAKLLAEDPADISFRASLIRHDAPERKKGAGEPRDGNCPNRLLLLKSPRRSWMFQFSNDGGKGTAIATDRAEFEKAISDLIA